jgi:hypothetical protein
VPTANEESADDSAGRHHAKITPVVVLPASLDAVERANERVRCDPSCGGGVMMHSGIVAPRHTRDARSRSIC